MKNDNPTCPRCGYTLRERMMIDLNLRDLLQVPDKYKNTRLDFRDFDIVLCIECGCPLKLKKEISLTEQVDQLRRLGHATAN